MKQRLGVNSIDDEERCKEHTSFDQSKKKLTKHTVRKTVATFQPRIGTMTTIAVAVLRDIKEAGGMMLVITQT